MANEIKLKDVKFDIHPSVVFKLGEDLVTDEVQALVELVKNSYDADASYASVKISTKLKNEAKDSVYKNAKGSIVIEDDGKGMTSEIIEKAWLIISNSVKGDMKKAGKTTKKGRTPLGDKGLGRLASQRLGDNIEIFTFPEKGKEGYYIGFKWTDFESKIKLSDVDITFKKLDKKNNKGTRLVISDLKHIEVWEEQKHLSKLLSKLSVLISPFFPINKFNLSINVNGEEKDLIAITKKIRDSSFTRYEIDFDKSNEVKGLSVIGKFRFSFLKSDQTREKQDLFNKYIEKDKGKAFLAHLKKKKDFSFYRIKTSNDLKWYFTSEYSKSFENIPDLLLIDGNKAYPGSFNGEIDSFNLREGYKKLDVFNSKSEYSNLIKNISGVHIYRDGFGIPVDKDWLDIGEQQVGGASFYGLRTHNTLGYISISAKENQCLQEISSREGFRDTPYYRNFYLILRDFIDFSEKLHTFIRRGVNEFLKKKEEENIGIDEGTNVDKAVDYIKKVGKDSKKSKDMLEKTSNEINKFNKTISNIRVGLEKNNKPSNKDLQDSLKSLEDTQKNIKNSIKEIGENLTNSDKLNSVSNVIKYELQKYEGQIEDFYQAASLGMTVEGLSHEINNIIDRFYERTDAIILYLKQKKINDLKIKVYLENAKSLLNGLRKQLTHLTPSLKYVREKREKIELNDFWKKEKEYYNERFSEKKIKLDIKNNNELFNIYMNKGKLIQIFENLIINSEYWLSQLLREKSIKEGIITIEIDNPYVYLYDNGKGIDSSVETSLFEPFVSCKRKGEGRGLGLFLVTQFLDSEGCSIQLSTERNKFKKMFKFIIDLSGVIKE